LHVVCPSVRPSVTLVDQDHIGWKSINQSLFESGNENPNLGN